MGRKFWGGCPSLISETRKSNFLGARMLCITSRACITSEMFYVLTILLICDCLSSLGAAPLAAVAEEDAALDRILYSTNLEPSCRYQKVSCKSDPTWAKFSLTQAPLSEFSHSLLVCDCSRLWRRPS